jgi:CRISPR-associated protein Cas6
MGSRHAELGEYPKMNMPGTNKPMAIGIPEMTDIAFDLGGESLRASYPFSLWAGLARLAPLLEEQKYAGILPLRLAANSDGMLLPKRAKLILRLPAELAGPVTALLSEQQIEVDGSRLNLGKGKARPILPSPTLHAQIVAGITDEVQFMADINLQLHKLGVAGNLICGKRHTITGKQQSIHGFSLVIHDLKPEASLKLQYAGLGGSRQFGCGIFIPYKVISGLSDD